MISIQSTCPVMRPGTFRPVALGSGVTPEILDAFCMTEKGLLVPYADKKRRMAQTPLSVEDNGGIFRAIALLFDDADHLLNDSRENPETGQLREPEKKALWNYLTSTRNNGLGESLDRPGDPPPSREWYFDASSNLPFQTHFFNSHGWSLHFLQETGEQGGTSFLIGAGWIGFWMVYFDVRDHLDNPGIRAIVTHRTTCFRDDNILNNISQTPQSLLQGRYVRQPNSSLVFKKGNSRADCRGSLESSEFKDTINGRLTAHSVDSRLRMTGRIEDKDPRRESASIHSLIHFSREGAEGTIREVHVFDPSIEAYRLSPDLRRDVFRPSFFPSLTPVPFSPTRQRYARTAR